MVKATTVLSLLATATSTVARQASPAAAPPGTDVIPGAYIVEFEEGQVRFSGPPTGRCHRYANEAP